MLIVNPPASAQLRITLFSSVSLFRRESNAFAFCSRRAFQRSIKVDREREERDRERGIGRREGEREGERDERGGERGGEGAGERAREIQKERVRVN